MYSRATGMFKTWDDANPFQLRQTCLMTDMIFRLQTLQKNPQKRNPILPGVIILKNNVIQKLRLIVDNTYRSVHEEQEQLLKSNSNEEQEDDY